MKDSTSIPATYQAVERMVAVAFGPGKIGQGRYHDTARDIISRRTDPPTPEATALLAKLQDAADQKEEERVAARNEAKNRTADNWQRFIARRAELSEAPEGTIVVHLRDEKSGLLHRLAIPQAFFVE